MDDLLKRPPLLTPIIAQNPPINIAAALLEAPTNLMNSFSATQSLVKTVFAKFAPVALVLLCFAQSAKANTQDTVVSGSTDLSQPGTYSGGAPTSSSDVTFSGAYSPATFNLGATPGFNLNIGTLDDASTTALTISGTTAQTSGTITLNGGTNSDTSLGAAAFDLLFVGSGGNLTIANGTGAVTLATVNSGNIDDAGTLVISGSLSIGAAKALTFTGAGATTLGGNIAATTGTFVVNDAGGSVTLTGTDNATGGVTVSGGTLNIGGGGATGSIVSTNALTLNGGALSYTVINSGTQTFVSTALNAGGATVTASTGDTIQLGTITRAAGGTINFGTTGSVTTPNTNSNGILGGWATYGAGTSTVFAVSGQSAGAAVTGLSSYSQALTVAGDTNTAHNDSLGASLTLGVSTNPTINTLTINDTTNGDTLALGANNLTFTAGGGLLYSGNQNYNITGSGVIGAPTNTGETIITVSGTGALTIGTLIGSSTATAASLTKSGPGTLILSGVNVYTGGTVINGGILQYTNIGTANGTNSGAFTLAGGNLQINQAANNFSYNPTITLTADSTLSNIGAGAVNYGGTLTGNNHALNVNTGASRLFINSSALTGVTQFNVTAGQLGTATDSGNQLNGAPVVVSNGATFDLYNGGSTAKTASNNITLNGGTGLGGVGALYRETGGSGTITESGAVTLNSTSSIGVASAGPLVLSGNVTGAGGLTKIGAGTLTLSGNDTYSGQTTILSGTLSETGGSIGSTTLNVGAGTFAYSKTGGTQSFTTTNLTSGAVINNTIASTTLNLGTLSAPVGTAVDFTTLTGAVTTITANTGTTILGGWATTGGGANWAVSAGNGSTAGAITALGSYTNDTWAAGNNTTVTLATNTAYNNVTTDSLRFNSAAADTVTLSGTDVITTGGILVTPTVGNNLSQITGGTLEGSSGGELVVNEWDASNQLTIASIIADNTTATALTKAGPGLLVLSGPNTYTGGTYIDGGSVVVGADSNLGGNGTITLNGGTLRPSVSIPLASGHLLSIGSDGGTISPTGGSGNFTLGTANQLGGSGTLTLSGQGTGNDILSITATQSNFTGNISISNGRLGVDPTTFASSPLGSGTITINSGGTLRAFNGAGSSLPNTIYIAGNGDGVGAIHNKLSAANPLTFSGPVILTAAAQVGSDAGSTTNFSGGISGAFTLTLNSTSNGAVFGLSGVNTQTGLSFAGGNTDTLKLSGNGTLGASNVAFSFSSTAGVDTLDMGSTSQTIGTIANTGTILNNGGGTSVLTINGGGTTSTIFKNNTTGTGTLGLTVGGGTLALAGANTYTGATTVAAGTLQAGVATVGGAIPTSGAFGVNSAVSLYGGATLDLKGFNETIGSLSDNSGSGGTVTSSLSGSTPTLIVGGLNTSTSFAGVIQNGSGTVGLTKIGSGTLTLNGTNSYTGVTTVTSGTLNLTRAGTAGNGGTLSASTALNLTGGTLLLSASNAIGTASAVNMNAGTYRVANASSEGTAQTITGATYSGGTASGGGTATGGTATPGSNPNAQGVGGLTLSGNSTLDFGSGKSTQVFGAFDPTNGGASNYTLNIANYTTTTTNILVGTSGTDGSDDRLVFNEGGANGGNGLTSAQLADITFGGVQDAGQIFLGNGYYEVGAVPEPTTILGGLLLVGFLGYRERRRMKGLARRLSA